MSLVSAGSTILSKYTMFPFVNNKMFFTGIYSRKTQDPKRCLSLKKNKTQFEVQSCPRVVRLGIASCITKSVIISAGVKTNHLLSGKSDYFKAKS